MNIGKLCSCLLVTGIFLSLLLLLSNGCETAVILEQKENNLESADFNHVLEKSPSLDLTPHDPINIFSDNGFLSYGFNGTGTSGDPYIIEGYDIRTSSWEGISIKGTTKHFVVRSCYVMADYYGIEIGDVAAETASIINNTCNYNEEGIHLYGSSGSTLINNTCYRNEYIGLVIHSSSLCLITNNLFQENDGQGMEVRSNDNLIHHNRFVLNHYRVQYQHSQARDEGKGNKWYDSETKEGNFWSNLGTSCTYKIEGSAHSKDLYPLNRAASCPNPVVISTISIVLPILGVGAILAFVVPKYVIPYYRKQRAESRPIIEKKMIVNILIIVPITISVLGILLLTYVIYFETNWSEYFGLLLIGAGNILAGVVGIFRLKMGISNKYIKIPLILISVIFISSGILFLVFFIISCLLLGHC